ncbi:phenylacetate--CoA ligase family protein [Leeuwenhoekiella sp. W20_SRS_FM14]|uniref:phenylacetate--CoA ligase family protein n=1 Tax=Leeuwenhoekiella sp. W20_SRS_FM14 TaxID=3240270 RepID=UPI003F9D18CB
MNLTNLSLRFNGFDIASAKRKLEALKREVATDSAQYYIKRRSQILEFHLKNNSFYRNLVAGNPTGWDSLPVLTKADLQKPLEERLSEGFSKRNSHVHKTSGSSGNPFIFAKDKYCHALTWASIQNLYLLAGVNLNTSYEARFYGIPQGGMPFYKERLKDVLSNRYRFSIFDASDQNFEKFINRFKHVKFGHLNGYTSTLVLFAHYLRSKNLILKQICPSLTHCIVTAEILLKDDKLLLEQQFGVPVLNEYGSSETGVIAFGKAENPLKIDTALLYVEILDDQNKPVPNGTSGKIVITSLFNKAHPFIRYQIGDLGVINRDEDNNTILTHLDGRIGDFAILPNGKKVPALAFYYVTKTVIEDSGNVKEFIINQNKPNKFTIKYVADIAFKEFQLAKIEKALKTYLNQEIEFDIVRQPFLDRSNRGKLRQFKRDF